MLPLGAILLSSHVLIFTADAVPRLDLQKTCQLEAALSTEISQDKAACVDDQQKARDLLTKQWPQYSAADKSICLDMSASKYMPGYVELLTCLEMFQFAKTVHNESAPQSKSRKR